MKNPIQTFEPNTAGRDFVIGDLHGSYAVFQNLLKNLNFDKSKDRMFSVGDLVDRGPESLKTLELLYEPWFHAVLSNHEQMMYEAFTGGYMGQFWLRNGGFWGAEALNTWRNNTRYATNELDKRAPTDDEHRLFDLIKVVGELPFIMTVKLTNGKQVHIIHAELPPLNSTNPPLDAITDEVLADPEKVMALATVQSHDGDYFTWGRHLFYHFYKAHLADLDKVKRTVAYHHGKGTVFNDKLSHIISGHTIVQHPLTILGQTNIDTCAYGSMHAEASKWESLTALELNAWKFYQATSTEFREVQSVVVTEADLQPKRVPQPPAA